MILHLVKQKNSYLKWSIVILLSIALIYKGAQALWGEHYLTFFKGVIKNPLQVGAFSPCSTFVADAITKHIANSTPEKIVRVLEVGAGSGVFTTKIEDVLNKKNKPYQVDVIEIDPEYVDLLQKRFASNEQIAVYNHNIVDWKPEYTYDYIISALPFTNMKIEDIEAILGSYKGMIADGGIVSYIEHMWLPQIKELFLSADKKEAYQKKRSLIGTFKNAFVFESVPVWANITPVYVHHLRIAAQ